MEAQTNGVWIFTAVLLMRDFALWWESMHRNVSRVQKASVSWTDIVSVSSVLFAVVTMFPCLYPFPSDLLCT